MSSTDLSAMGQARVEQQLVDGRVAIRKGPLTRTEDYFYRHLIHHPDFQGPLVPEVYGWEGDAVLLEWIPNPIAANETLKADLLGSLSRLHAQSLKVPDECLFQFNWTTPQLERALVHFPIEQRAPIRQKMQPWYQEVEDLLAPQLLISGDSNHGNWGRRASGEAVLFDWERLGRGSPAIDLAPLIPGLSGQPVVTDYVRLYRSTWPDCPFSETRLVRQVLQTMALVAIEVVNILHDRANAEAQRYQQWFNQRYLGWLESISSSS
ncbi:phosphotransferase [Saccharospirillum sp. HFRX-1]|uniref:phosphotransferase family protein n=1 Tax=unclassified Saccharospirillum TaxID=2633430 RepID=UPI00371A588B